MKRTIITAVTFLLSSNLGALGQQGPMGLKDDLVANADVSELVIQDEMMHLRRLVNATKVAAEKKEKKAE